MRRALAVGLCVASAAVAGCHDAAAPGSRIDSRPIFFMTLASPGWSIGSTTAENPSAVVLQSDSDRQSPAVDRAGTKLAFTTNRALYVANIDGSNAVLIPNVAGDRLAWSPDGTRIAVGKRFGDNEPGVAIVTLATGHVDPLVLGSGLRPDAATWSPDGKRLLVEVPGNGAGSGIFSTRPDGTDPQLVVAPVSYPYGWVRDASFSPDGRRIVFARYDTTGSEIWTANADGSSAQLLPTTDGFFKVEPVWAPSGRFVAFSYQSGGGRYDIEVVPLDGGVPWLVTSNLAWGGTGPTW